MTHHPPAAVLTRAIAEISPNDLRELLDACASLLDAAPFGEEAMSARERIAYVTCAVGVYPQRRKRRRVKR